jgi:hypothetical protein
MRTVLVSGAALFCFASVAWAEVVNICGVGPSGEVVTPSTAQACTCREVEITGKTTEDRDEAEDRAELSGVVVDKDKTRLIAIANEGFGSGKRNHALQIFEGNLADGYVFKRDVTLFEVPEGLCNEADFEGLTRHGDDLFAITSHSRDRKKQDDDADYDENRKRLTAKGISGCPWRYQLKQFRLKDSAEVSDMQDVNLLAMILSDPVLAPFVALPNKENGVDIEGLATTKNGLYVGFRGPVLRQNYVPVLHLNRDLSPIPSEPNPLFVRLGGRGIRDLTAILDEDKADGDEADGERLYILAGPNGDETQTFAIYFWDGKDQVGGVGGSKSKPEDNERCRLGTFDKVKPEGIAYLDSDASGDRFLLLFDGGKRPTAKILTLNKKK